jgi:superfamily II DNA/RNA helicase
LRFTEFDFHPQLLEGIDASGYENATPVQEQVIPSILKGRDIIASAQTGTGKTAAFLLPVMNNLLSEPSEGLVKALIIVPTRELAIQISQHLEGLSYFTDVSSIAIYGGNDGQNFVAEKKALQMGADIVICTPGRMISHLNMGYANMKGLKYLILDEADRMLDMGFQDDINRIIQTLPAQRQTLLFSATMPDKIRQLARNILKDPVEVNIAISKPPEKIVQRAYVVYEPQKLPLVLHILKNTPFKSCLIFCSSKMEVKNLNRTLRIKKFASEEMHSDLEQAQREEIISGFTSGRIPILVATDILSRGIDIDTIDLVLNYEVPHDGEDYVHRIGRTARAEADGMAFTFVSEKEQNKFASIERLIGKEVEKAAVPPELGPVPAYQPRTRGGGGGNRGGGSRHGGRDGGRPKGGHHHGGPRQGHSSGKNNRGPQQPPQQG